MISGLFETITGRFEMVRSLFETVSGLFETISGLFETISLCHREAIYIYQMDKPIYGDTDVIGKGELGGAWESSHTKRDRQWNEVMGNGVMHNRQSISTLPHSQNGGQGTEWRLM